MGRGSPLKTRTDSKKTLSAPSSRRPRASVRTGGDGGSSLLDPTPPLSRLKVGEGHTHTHKMCFHSLYILENVL